MPVALTFPGVYIEEIPSGVRTITGVATSITLFIGWAPRGPTDRALRLTASPTTSGSTAAWIDARCSAIRSSTSTTTAARTPTSSASPMTMRSAPNAR